MTRWVRENRSTILTTLIISGVLFILFMLLITLQAVGIVKSSGGSITLGW